MTARPPQGRRATTIAVVVGVLVLGALAALGFRSLLLGRASTDLDAEFERRSDTALSGMVVEIERYEEKLRIIASFAGAMDVITPETWQRFGEDTGVLELDSNSAVAYLEFVPPPLLGAHLDAERSAGLDGSLPVALPERLLGDEDLALVTRLAWSPDKGVGRLPAADLGSLPSVRSALERLRTTGELQAFAYGPAVEDALAIDEQVATTGVDLVSVSEMLMDLLAPQADSVDDLGYGLFVPVRADRDGPVVGAVLAGTLPIDGVQRIDGTIGDDLTVNLVAQHGVRGLMSFYGDAPADPDARSRSVQGNIGGIAWTSTVTATPAFEARLDSSGADATAIVVAGLAVLVALLVVVRDRLGRRAALAAERMAEAEDRAGRDPLTGLLNRVGLDRSIDLLGLEPPRPLAVLFIDLDGLKRVNDTLGHDAGDVLIRAAASRLRVSLRDGDVVARQGGDEFVVLAPGIGSGADADRLAAAILDAFAVPVPGLGPEIPVDASIGVALATSVATVGGAIAAADVAMYEAKTAGGRRVVRAGSDALRPTGPETVLTP
jgi:diguanylate cyclase (GGDEF)-like protein